MLLCMALLFAPLVSLVMFAFNSSDTLGLPFEGFTTSWFTALFDDREAMEALRTTLIVAAIVTAVSVVLGLVSGYAIARAPARLGGVVLALHAVPLVVPWLVIGVSGLLFFQWVGVQGSVLTIVLMQTVVTFPLVTLVLYSGLVGLEPAVEEAGLDLGSSQVGVLLRLVLPQLVTPLITSAVFAFISSIGNFVVTFFVSGYSATLPIWGYSELRHAENLPVVNAASTLMLALNLVFFFVVVYLSRRDKDAVSAWL
ncbi:ABC transporter permease [Nocardioides bigeumensis]|uniref:ABC transporter permease n=2 Tax=Nocardioides bigeumensis TaxID=433657 RepID=A0ABN2YZT2_9ACTN